MKMKKFEVEEYEVEKKEKKLTTFEVKEKVEI